GPELAAGLDALMQWIEQGTKPTPQSIAASCQRLRVTNDGPCRYHPEFTPKGYETRYARGAAVAEGALTSAQGVALSRLLLGSVGRGPAAGNLRARAGWDAPEQESTAVRDHPHNAPHHLTRPPP